MALPTLPQQTASTLVAAEGAMMVSELRDIDQSLISIFDAITDLTSVSNNMLAALEMMLDLEASMEERDRMREGLLIEQAREDAINNRAQDVDPQSSIAADDVKKAMDINLGLLGALGTAVAGATAMFIGLSDGLPAWLRDVLGMKQSAAASEAEQSKLTQDVLTSQLGGDVGYTLPNFVGETMDKTAALQEFLYQNAVDKPENKDLSEKQIRRNINLAMNPAQPGVPQFRVGTDDVPYQISEEQHAKDNAEYKKLRDEFNEKFSKAEARERFVDYIKEIDVRLSKGDLEPEKVMELQGYRAEAVATVQRLNTYLRPYVGPKGVEIIEKQAAEMNFKAFEVPQPQTSVAPRVEQGTQVVPPRPAVVGTPAADPSEAMFGNPRPLVISEAKQTPAGNVVYTKGIAAQSAAAGGQQNITVINKGGDTQVQNNNQNNMSSGGSTTMNSSNPTPSRSQSSEIFGP